MITTHHTTRLTARSRALLSAALVAAGVLSAGAASAGAEPSKPVVADPAPFKYLSPADREHMERQAPLIEAADVIQKAVDLDVKNHGSGFTSIELGGDSVILHWKGGIPRAVREAMDTARRDAPVEVKAAKHSKAELDAAEERIRQELTLTAGPGFSMEIPADGDGIVLNTEGDVEAAKRRVPYVGMAVTVKHKLNPKQTSRLADYPSWWGGAKISNKQYAGFCSTGFGVSNSYGSRFILTAGHCGYVGNDWTNGNGTLNTGWDSFGPLRVGTTYSKHTAYEIMLIPAAAGGRIYDGGVGVNEFSKDVVGAGGVYKGEWLCTSGTVSGAVCGYIVDNYTFSYCGYSAGSLWKCYSDLSTAPQQDGMVGVRSGDSGGPVFNLSGPNVIAKGIISGQANGGRTLIFQDWGTIVAVWPGLSPL